MAPKDGPGTATHHGEVGTEFGADPEGSAKDNVNATEAELRAWMTLGTDALAMFEQLITLLRLELTLAIADGKRLILVGLAMIPLVLLAWIGFSVLVAWVVYAITASVAVGLSGFLLLQISVLAVRDADGETRYAPDADVELEGGSTLVVLGRLDQVAALRGRAHGRG